MTALHGCQCEHKRTAHVHETKDNRSIWKGDVEIFSLYDHPLASKAFAWGHTDKDGKLQVVAILNEGSVLSPRDAVLSVLLRGISTP